MARQGELFPTHSSRGGTAGATPSSQACPLLGHQLLDWQRHLSAFQQPLFQERAVQAEQQRLFEGDSLTAAADEPDLNLLLLQPQSLTFWRWPKAPQHGAALYFVTDHSTVLQADLLLYVGETGQAAQRWKGDHDCKSYVAAYSEALARSEISSQLSIRFWLDAPRSLRLRRALEQRLIQRWQPPFNKETRQRWATPFTTEQGS